MAIGTAGVAAVLKKYENDLLADWIKDLKSGGAGKESRIHEAELFSQAKEFVGLLQQAAQRGDPANFKLPEMQAISNTSAPARQLHVLLSLAACPA